MSSRPEKPLLAERKRLEDRQYILHLRVTEVDSAIERVDAALDALRKAEPANQQ